MPKTEDLSPSSVVRAMYRSSIHTLAASLIVVILAGCGGGGDDESAPGDERRSIQAVRLEPVGAADVSARAAAASATAQSTTNACAAVRPFYWEIGDKTGRAVAGSVQRTGSRLTYNALTVMPLASASKWLYGAYVVQRRNGTLSASDLRFLTMRSGYASMSTCLRSQNVDSCLAYGNNGNYSPQADGAFFYDSGHMQQHASLLGLGAMVNTALAAEMRSVLGNDLPSLSYSQPMLASGAQATPDDYGRALRKMLGGQLKIGEMLGSQKVCTNPATCRPGEALLTPVPADQSWHYSLGHWVEDDPTVGDGAFSSPGTFGFYPWIDADRTHYGVVARVAELGAFSSAACGKLIRRAWLSSSVQ
jgi:hypothetical protein